MTFEEWKEQNLNRFTCSHEVFVAYEAWQQQQTRINELVDYIQNTDSQKRIDELESQLEDATMFHYKRGFQDAKEIHMRKNAGLLANIKVLEAQLEVADIRPMEESAYFERIEELEQQVEWHKRRAEGWRSIAVLEEQGK